MDISKIILKIVIGKCRLLVKRELAATRMTIVYMTNESASVLIDDKDMNDEVIASRLEDAYNKLMSII